MVFVWCPSIIVVNTLFTNGLGAAYKWRYLGMCIGRGCLWLGILLLASGLYLLGWRSIGGLFLAIYLIVFIAIFLCLWAAGGWHSRIAVLLQGSFFVGNWVVLSL